jgi:hypothetical protein
MRLASEKEWDMPEPKFTTEDAILGVLDNALSSAEGWLEELLPSMSTAQIAERFALHCQSHLHTELENIRAHGHRNDDPDDVPQQ